MRRCVRLHTSHLSALTSRPARFPSCLTLQTIDFIPSDVATMGFQRHPSRTSSATREKRVSMPHIAGEPYRERGHESAVFLCCVCVHSPGPMYF